MRAPPPGRRNRTENAHHDTTTRRGHRRCGHRDTHTAAAVDSAGRVLGSAQFEATTAGYAALLGWLRSFGTLVLVGVEGAGAYGAGLARHLRTAGVRLVEVDRPDRRTRRWQGKSDPVDAEAAARTALAARRTGVPKTATGRSRRCGACAWPGAAPSRPAPTRSGRYSAAL
ncbi:IS110 family transposase [Micromonospora chersina]|uniref:IS110 family transposase n=1 Tax=Micromonospora chersina TaxID=47854 RepID=UPI003D8E2EE3